MTRSWKVVVTTGAPVTHTWTVTDETPPGFGLTDQLTIGWVNPDAQHRPAQPDPMVASFGVVVNSAEDLDDLHLGNPVSIKVTFGPVDKPEPDVTFWGRVSDGEAAPHPRGMLYRFTCADASTDLAGYDLGALAYDAVPVGLRQSHLIARAGLAEAQVVRDPVAAATDPNLYVEAIPQPGAANLLTSMIDMWGWVALTGPAGAYRAIVAPHPAPGGGDPYAWALDAIPDAFTPTAAVPLPGRFGRFDLPSTADAPDPLIVPEYGVYFDPDDRKAGVIDACVVDFDSQWTATQDAIANRAAVVWLYAAGLDPKLAPRIQIVSYVTDGPPAAGQPVVTTTREINTLGQDGMAAINDAGIANAQRLGEMMIPPPANTGAWSPGAFRWLLYADPVGQATFPLIFPRHEFSNDTAAGREKRGVCYVRPVVVTGILGRWNAAGGGRDWIGGQLTRATLTIEDGRPVIDFELAPTLPDTAAGGFTWNDKGLVAAPSFGIRWDDLYPQTWDSYRLARATP